MANICTARYIFLGPKDKVLALLKQSQGVAVSQDAAYTVQKVLTRYGSKYSFNEADQKTAFWQAQIIEAANEKESEARANLNNIQAGHYQSCFPQEVTRRPAEEQEFAARAWIQAKQENIRTQDKLRSFQKERTSKENEAIGEEVDFEENIQGINIGLLPITNYPETILIQEWSTKSQFYRKFMGHRSDGCWKEEENHWEEQEDGQVLFYLTGDHKWWCPVNVMKHVSVQWPGIYVGIAYLEEQGIWGQRLYFNGVEIHITVGAIGTLPSHCYELVEENGERWNSLKWAYAMDWQRDIVLKEIEKHQKRGH